MKKETYTHIVIAAIAVAIIVIMFASVALSHHQSKTATSSILQQNITNITFGANTVELPANTSILNFNNNAQSCPGLALVQPIFTSLLINTTNISPYTISGYKDILLSPSESKTIYYNELRWHNTLKFNYFNISYNRVANVSNKLISEGYNVTFNNTTRILTQTLKRLIIINNKIEFYSLQPSVNLTLDKSGINVFITPSSEITYFNSSNTITAYRVKVYISALPNAIHTTYLIILGPTFCNLGSRFLLTIGSVPYNGSIPNYSASG